MNPPVGFRQGFTLIEVLVAIAIFAIVTTMSGYLLTSAAQNISSRGRMTINQAAQAYIENVQDGWRDSTAFGRLDAATQQPTTLSGYSWAVKVCEVDVSTFSCKTAPLSQTTQPVFIPSSTARLMRLSISYTSSQVGGGSLIASTEISLK